jgi:hypothetical protein
VILINENVLGIVDYKFWEILFPRVCSKSVGKVETYGIRMAGTFKYIPEVRNSRESQLQYPYS